MKEKSIKFSFLVGDLPTYKLILELQIENPYKFLNIVPIVGAFQKQMTYIYVIYKRFLGFGISDLLVLTCMIVGRSGFERKTLQTGIAMHHAIARSSHSQKIEHCSRK